MEQRRAPGRSIDDSRIANRIPSMSFEDELKQKAMTLGRPAKKKPKPIRPDPVQDSEEPIPPPPPPSRRQSRKSSNTEVTQEDCPNPPPPPRSRSIRTPDNSGFWPPTSKPVRYQSKLATSNVSSLASSIESQSTDETPLVRQLPKRSESQKAIAPGIASRRAFLQASLAPSDCDHQGTSSAAENDQQETKPKSFKKPSKPKPELPPKETSDDRGYTKFETVPKDQSHRSITSQYKDKSLDDNDHTTATDSQHERIADTPPILPKWPPAEARIPSIASNRSISASCYIQPIASQTHENDTSERRVSLIKESSSLESLDSYQEPPELPSRVVHPPTLSEMQKSKPQRKPSRSKSFKTRLRKSKTDTEESLNSDYHQQEQTRLSSFSQEDRNPMQDHSLQSNQTSTSSKVHDQGLAGPVDLLTIVSNYTQFLPMCVKVCHAESSSNYDSFSRFQQLYLHFVKNCRVGVLQDEVSQEEYSVPISSTMRFGLAYEGEDVDVSRYLRTVGDIMDLKLLPKAVLVSKSFDGGSPEKSVESNEILFIKKISKSVKFGKGRTLDVCTVDKREKHLSSKCEGDFSIHPMDVQMTLSTLAEQSVQPPLGIYLFPDSKIRPYFPPTMLEQQVILESIRSETSVICTIKAGKSDEEQNVFDVSTNINLQVQVEPITENDEHELYNTTTQFYHSLNPSQLQSITDKPTKRSYDLQCLLYQNLIAGKEMDGVHFQLPNMSTFDIQPLTERVPSQAAPPPEVISIASSDGVISNTSSLAESNDGLYEDISTACAELPTQDANRLNRVMSIKSTLNAKIFRRKPAASKIRTKQDESTDFDYVEHAPEEPIHVEHASRGVDPEECYEPVMGAEMDNPEGDYSSVRTIDVPSLPRSVKGGSGSSADTDHISQSQYALLSNKISNIVSELGALKAQVHKLATTVDLLMTKSSTDTASTAEAPSRPTTSPSLQKSRDQNEEAVKNREFLASISCDQVLQLLDKMSLSSYKTEFQRRAINGRQLLEIDEATLQETFKMRSNFHRKKFMRVKSGAIYAGTYLS